MRTNSLSGRASKKTALNHPSVKLQHEGRFRSKVLLRDPFELLLRDLWFGDAFHRERLPVRVD